MKTIPDFIHHLFNKRVITQIILIIPAMVTSIDALTGNLTANPIQAATQRTGQIAIILLALSLLITPLKVTFGWAFLSSLRRTLGLYAFYYAAGHFILFAVVDYGLDLELLAASISEKPYIVIGLVVLLVLFALAVTSNRLSKLQLGKNWKRLHKLVYLAAPLAGLHFAMALKSDIFHLRGNIFWPVVYLISIGLLLILRIPWIKQKLEIFHRKLVMKNHN
jgi:methionine sulfoxide reductase heme-binding subunit